MPQPSHLGRLSVEDMEAVLNVTRDLAAPHDLATLLNAVVAAAKQLLKADRGSVWLYDAAADEMVTEISTLRASGCARSSRRRGSCR